MASHNLCFTGPSLWPLMISKQLKMEGFLVNRWQHHHREAVGHLTRWLEEVRTFGHFD